MIPRVLHYVWFGGGAYDDQMRRCIESWRTYLPGFEWVRWDEFNAPIERYPYLRSALDSRCWANASNLIRLHALYYHGGVYLDTDIELIKPLDDLLRRQAFAGFQSPGLVNSAVLGAVADHGVIGETLEAIQDRFDGTELAHESGPNLITDILRRHGLSGDACGPLSVGDVHLEPAESFYPYPWDGVYSPDCVTPRTYCVHHWAKTWHEPPQPKAKQRRRLVVGVMSGRNLFERRERCRRTWFRHGLSPADVELVFFVGGADGGAPHREGDVVELPCPDDYQHLPQKTRCFVEWADQHFDFDFLFKCDDDTYLCVERLFAMLDEAPAYLGHDMGDFASGGAGYLLSRVAASLIPSGLLEHTRGAEDELVGMLMRHSGIVLQHDWRFRFDATQAPGPGNDQISCHWVQDDRMHDVHRTFCSAPPT